MSLKKTAAEKRLYVSVGIQTDAFIEITEGLEEGMLCMRMNKRITRLFALLSGGPSGFERLQPAHCS